MWLSKLGAPNRNQTCLRLASNPTRNINPAQNLAVLGGNDPHSYGVTSRRASMNTLRPKSLYENTQGCLTKIAVLTLPYRAVHGLVCQTHYRPTCSGAIYSVHLSASFPSFMQLGRVCAATDYSLAESPTGAVTQCVYI